MEVTKTIRCGKVSDVIFRCEDALRDGTHDVAAATKSSRKGDGGDQEAVVREGEVGLVGVDRGGELGG